MNRYIVTEEQLLNLSFRAFDAGMENGKGGGKLARLKRQEAEEACREIVVPEGATHFAKNVDGPLDYGLYSLDYDWPIPEVEDV